MHGMVRAALAGLGVEVQSCGTDLQSVLPQSGTDCKSVLRQVLCFLQHTPGDLLIGSSKVVGSAQRKARGALMQHGSILLAASPSTPALPGIAELSGRRLQAEEVCAAVTQEWSQTTTWPLEPGDWSEEERCRINDLVDTKYSTARWNRKR
jgi:lipoate-protein ligase A